MSLPPRGVRVSAPDQDKRLAVEASQAAATAAAETGHTQRRRLGWVRGRPRTAAAGTGRVCGKGGKERETQAPVSAGRTDPTLHRTITVTTTRRATVRRGGGGGDLQRPAGTTAAGCNRGVAYAMTDDRCGCSRQAETGVWLSRLPPTLLPPPSRRALPERGGHEGSWTGDSMEGTAGEGRAAWGEPGSDTPRRSRPPLSLVIATACWRVGPT